jgi:DNA ligase-1
MSPGSLPDVTAVVRGLSGGPFILDGEVVALDAAGRPLPFQELMRRFRRVHGVESLAREMPLALHFFDCLLADGRSLIDAPQAERWEALARVTGGRYLAERELIDDVETARTFHARALAAGHEGVMAKDPRSSYEPGGRGKRWFKLKTPETIDCVIIAADRGSGRRVGWLSNYHLAVRDGETFADVGKTFKGLTDAEFGAMTERLRALALADDGYTVRVRPDVVVEVEYNEIQRSPTYRSGMALRFARIARIREDKGPSQATTLEELRALYERQFATKGRAGEGPVVADAALPLPAFPSVDVHVHLHPEGLARAVERWFAQHGWTAGHPFEPAAVADTLRARGVRRFCFFSYAHKPGMSRCAESVAVRAGRPAPGGHRARHPASGRPRP